MINIVKKKWHLAENSTKLPLEKFLSLLEFVFDNSYFQYNDQYYKQTYGLGMGNCLSPVCSDLVMQDLQEYCINKLTYQLPFFKRYVDDIITSIPNDTSQHIIDVFNSYHPRLKFTIEKENNSKIPFLDVLLIRNENGTIDTDWYHKPTFSERFLNYSSQHPLNQKINIIQNLKTRAISLSSEKFHTKNLDYIKDILTKNNYPISLIKQILNKNNTKQKINRQDKEIYCKIPYIKHLSEKIKLTFLNQKTIQGDSISIAQKCENTIKTKFYSKLKAKTEKELQSNVIYNIPCLGCNKCYIGQTGRYLKQRLKEHNNDQKNYLLKSNPTALVEHKINTGHNFNFDNVTILDIQSNYKKRLTSEMIQIQKNNKNSVNKRTDIDSLNRAYFNILEKTKK